MPTTGWDTSLAHTTTGWTVASTTARCVATSVKANNIDGLSYSTVVTENGIAPNDGSLGWTAYWVGQNGGACNTKLNLYARFLVVSPPITPATTCLPVTDARSDLDQTTPIIGYTIGAPRCGTKKLVIKMMATDESTLWLNGPGAGVNQAVWSPRSKLCKMK